MLFFVFLLYSRFSFSLFLVAASEDAEQVEEEIGHDELSMEVKVDGEMKHISSFPAFVVALASRIGTGNLAGVATAVSIGDVYKRQSLHHSCRSELTRQGISLP